MLVRYATQHGFQTRFNTGLTSFEEEASTGKILVSVRDEVSKMDYKIRTEYLFGADGARSRVVKQLGLPLTAKPGGGVAINVLVKTDLSHLMEHRKGNLHWFMQPDREHPDFGWLGLMRMVKPWHEWMFILFPSRDADLSRKPSKEEYQQRVRDMIGDDTPAEILNISQWGINEIIADEYAKGNV